MDLDTICQKLPLKVVLKEPHPNNMGIATCNTEHFGRISNLYVENWRSLSNPVDPA